MTNNYLTPKEIHEELVKIGQYKADMTFEKRFLMSIMAGLYISLGAQGFLVTYDNIFLRAAVFPVGLMLIVIVGGELFTGNCLMTFSFIQKKITLKGYANALTQVYFGNLIGSLTVIMLLYFGGIYNNPVLAGTIIKIAKAKISLSFSEAVLRGILCNILVSLGVWFATAAKDTTGKLLGCWFPVMLFALCGYEHCIANMFYLPFAALLDPTVSLGSILFNNLLPVTIGNFIGGGILIPIVYHKIHYVKN